MWSSSNSSRAESPLLPCHPCEFDSKDGCFCNDGFNNCAEDLFSEINQVCTDSFHDELFVTNSCNAVHKLAKDIPEVFADKNTPQSLLAQHSAIVSISDNQKFPTSTQTNFPAVNNLPLNSDCAELNPTLNFATLDSISNINRKVVYPIYKSSHSKSLPSRGAIIARHNRAKKKAQLVALENLVSKVTAENKALIDEQQQMKSTINELNSKISYLNGLLANDSELSKILKAVSNVPGMTVTSNNLIPFESKNCFNDHSYSKMSLKSFSSTKQYYSNVSDKTASPGICLHVTNGSVSLELCQHCNANYCKNEF